MVVIPKCPNVLLRGSGKTKWGKLKENPVLEDRHKQPNYNMRNYIIKLTIKLNQVVFTDGQPSKSEDADDHKDYRHSLEGPADPYG